MEELQRAIEDAQYVNAISTQDDGPKPVLAWEVPNEEQLAEWQNKIRKQASDGIEPFSLDWVLANPIGFFLFSAYLKSVENDYLRINFVEEVIRFKKRRGFTTKLSKAKKILSRYLSPRKIDDDSNELRLPKKIEIMELDLKRDKPSLNLSDEQMELMISLNLVQPSTITTLTTNTALTSTATDDNNDTTAVQQNNPAASARNKLVMNPTTNVIGVKGPILDEVFSIMSSVDIINEKEFQRADSMPMHALGPINPTPITPSMESISEHLEAKHSSKLSEVSTTNDQPNHNTPTTTIKHPTSKSENFALAADTQASMRNLTKRLCHSTNEAGDNKNSADRIPTELFDKIEIVVVESLKRDYWHKFLMSEQYTKINNFLWYRDRPAVQEDFFVMRVLGRGGFGLVTACKKGTSGKLYAMKVMNKKRIKMKKSEMLAVNERKVLAAVESKFVVNLKYSFHTTDEIFLILDLMTGGDLGYHLHIRRKFRKNECIYFAARIMLGLQALHNQHFVYRDLKPENCLLADDGRVKITDLGLATRITPTLHGAAGTRGYWAPEMLRRDEKGRRMTYKHTVDWFSFGCCVAEFISGSNPFRSENALVFGLERGHETKEKAIDCATLEMDPVFDPEKFEPDAADLCRRLLDKNENTRLGTNGCEEIMAHPWFQSVNWEAVISDREQPPFIPPKDVNAASQEEIGNFEESKALQDTIIDEKDKEFYKDWDWTNHRAYAAEVIEFLIYERVTGQPLVPINQHSSCCCTIM